MTKCSIACAQFMKPIESRRCANSCADGEPVRAAVVAVMIMIPGQSRCTYNATRGFGLSIWRKADQRRAGGDAARSKAWRAPAGMLRQTTNYRVPPERRKAHR